MRDRVAVSWHLEEVFGDLAVVAAEAPNVTVEWVAGLGESRTVNWAQKKVGRNLQHDRESP